MEATAAAKKAAAAQSELEGQKADLKQARAHIKALERLLKRELAEGDAERLEMAVRGEAAAEAAEARRAALQKEIEQLCVRAAAERREMCRVASANVVGRALRRCAGRGVRRRLRQRRPRGARGGVSRDRAAGGARRRRHRAARGRRGLRAAEIERHAAEITAAAVREAVVKAEAKAVKEAAAARDEALQFELDEAHAHAAVERQNVPGRPRQRRAARWAR